MKAKGIVYLWAGGVLALSLSVAGAASTNAPAPAAVPLKTAREVQKAVKDQYVGDTDKRMLTLVLTNKRGEERTSTLIRYRKKDNGLWRTLLFYLEPADVRGTSTLTIEVANEDDLQRIYLPALKKNRRIPTADKSKSWAGTDFSFEDLQEREVDDFEYSALDSATLDGHECYHYFTTPKPEIGSGYGKIENWIRKDIVQSLQAHYYDKKGTLIKILKFKKQEQIQGIWTTLHLEMTSVLDQHKTDFLTDKIVFNTSMDDSLFTERGMLNVSEKF
jgi:hypothetical protein